MRDQLKSYQHGKSIMKMNLFTSSESSVSVSIKLFWILACDWNDDQTLFNHDLLILLSSIHSSDQTSWFHLFHAYQMYCKLMDSSKMSYKLRFFDYYCPYEYSIHMKSIWFNGKRIFTNFDKLFHLNWSESFVCVYVCVCDGWPLTWIMINRTSGVEWLPVWI